MNTVYKIYKLYFALF